MDPPTDRQTWRQQLIQRLHIAILCWRAVIKDRAKWMINWVLAPDTIPNLIKVGLRSAWSHENVFPGEVSSDNRKIATENPRPTENDGQNWRVESARHRTWRTRAHQSLQITTLSSAVHCSAGYVTTDDDWQRQWCQTLTPFHQPLTTTLGWHTTSTTYDKWHFSRLRCGPSAPSFFTSCIVHPYER